MSSMETPGLKKLKQCLAGVNDMKVLPLMIFTMGWIAAYTLVAPSLGSSIEDAIRKNGGA